MPETPTVLVFLVDALRHDFVSEDATPFLHALGSEGVRRPLKPILGYSDAIRATAFTGRYPDETGYWMEYCFRPASSPWKGVARYAQLDRIGGDATRRALRFAASSVAAKASSRPHPSVRNIPLRAVDRLDVTLHEPMTSPMALGFPSIFDSCAARGRPWAYLDSSKVRRASDLAAQLWGLPDDVGLVFVYLHYVDMAAHLFGISSRLFWRRVTHTDAVLGQLLAVARRRFGDVETVTFSDHGMTELDRQIDLGTLLEHPGFPERFFLALDATMARLWYLDDDERLRDELRERVATRLPGHFLTEDERAEHHLQFSERLYGDDIFLLPPRTAIFPNFHSYLRPRAMHAYDPKDPDQWGIYLGPPHTAERLSEPVGLTEVTAVITGALGVHARERQ